MEWKKKIPEIRDKILKIWAAFVAACALGWDKAKVYAKRSWMWLKKNSESLRAWCRQVLGKLAVIALKVRKWVMKKTSRLREWWAHWKGREWLLARIEWCRRMMARIRAKLPQPAALEPEQETVEAAATAVIQTPAEAPVVRSVKAKKKYGKVMTVLVAIGRGIKFVCLWLFKLRKFIMAAPVVFYALKLAILNSGRLPDLVGLQIQASGEFARMVSRQTAVMMPLALTGFCLLLLFASRKTLLPWLISIFTLILPILIWMTNYYA